MDRERLRKRLRFSSRSAAGVELSPVISKQSLSEVSVISWESKLHSHDSILNKE